MKRHTSSRAFSIQAIHATDKLIVQAPEAGQPRSERPASPKRVSTFEGCADPPYSADDAKRYGTPMVNRAKALNALAAVVPVGGHLVWLDTAWPMHSKQQWLTVGRVAIVRSTT